MRILDGEANAAAAPLAAMRHGELRGWALLAIGSLAMAGALAVLLLLARTPGVKELLPWHWETFFYSALVTHVVFSFVVWYLAMLGALAAMVAPPGGGAIGRAGLWLALAGAGLLLVPTLANTAEPSLNNYVPVLIDPLYYAGLGLLAVGVALPSARILASRRVLADPLGFGIAASAACYLVALVCFALAWALLPADGDAANLNERLFWGGGHVLQFANTGMMLALWQALSTRLLGEPAAPDRLYRTAMAWLVVFTLPAPVFYFMFDVMGYAHRIAFTDLLWYGLTLPPAVMILGLGRVMWRRRAALPWGDAAFVGLALSLALFALGGVMGFFLGVGDTRTPSHYHAVISGVNAALMAAFVAYLLPRLGRPLPAGRLTRRLFWLYGGGQIVFSAGMFLAGASGVPRKTGGADQHLDTLAKQITMGVYGLGGALAVIGGIIFVWLVLRRLLARGAKHG